MTLDDVWQEDLSFEALVQYFLFIFKPFFKKRWVDAGFVLLSLRVFRLASVHEKKNRLWMLEIFLIAFERIQDCTGISLLRSMIVTVNSYHPLNQ